MCNTIADGYADSIAYPIKHGNTDGNTDGNSCRSRRALLGRSIHRGRITDVHNQPAEDRTNNRNLNGDVRYGGWHGNRWCCMYIGC